MKNARVNSQTDTALVDVAMNAFEACAPTLPIAIAYSGGADSTALLLACARRWPGEVVAWHIHHGLQPAADSFEQHCAQQCQRLGVQLLVRRIDAHAAHGESPEDAARAKRYAAFDSLALEPLGSRFVQTVALAQHADDQVETLLLALTRGAGLPGLAAMPMRWQRGSVAYWRPLLRVPRAAIHAWLRRQEVDWIEDPTNAEQRFTRNRIRSQILPALARVAPAFRATFARSARHAAEAQTVLTEIAVEDLERCGNPPRIAALRQLTKPRQANLLRHWLKIEYDQIPSSAQLAELQSQLQACSTRGHHIELKIAGGHVRRCDRVLRWVPDPEAPPAGSRGSFRDAP